MSYAGSYGENAKLPYGSLFTAEKLLYTSTTWANNKSTGPDGISHEAAKALLGDDIWKHRLLYTLNDFFYVAKIPEGVDKRITVLLPKIPVRLVWGGTRPITLSSTLLTSTTLATSLRESSHEQKHNYNGPNTDAKESNLLLQFAVSPKWRGIRGWIRGWSNSTSGKPATAFGSTVSASLWQPESGESLPQDAPFQPTAGECHGKQCFGSASLNPLP